MSPLMEYIRIMRISTYFRFKLQLCSAQAMRKCTKCQKETYLRKGRCVNAACSRNLSWQPPVVVTPTPPPMARRICDKCQKPTYLRKGRCVNASCSRFVLPAISIAASQFQSNPCWQPAVVVTPAPPPKAMPRIRQENKLPKAYFPPIKAAPPANAQPSSSSGTKSGAPFAPVWMPTAKPLPTLEPEHGLVAEGSGTIHTATQSPLDTVRGLAMLSSCVPDVSDHDRPFCTEFCSSESSEWQSTTPTYRSDHSSSRSRSRSREWAHFSDAHDKRRLVCASESEGLDS